MSESLHAPSQEVLTPDGKKIAIYPSENKFGRPTIFTASPLRSADVAAADFWLRNNSHQTIQSLHPSNSYRLSPNGVGLSFELSYETKEIQTQQKELEPVSLGKLKRVDFVQYKGTGIYALLPEESIGKALVRFLWQTHRVKAEHIKWAENQLSGKKYQRYEFLDTNTHQPVIEVCFIVSDES